MKYEYRAKSLAEVVTQAVSKGAAPEKKYFSASGSVYAPLGGLGSGDQVEFNFSYPETLQVNHSCDGKSGAGYFVEVSIGGRVVEDSADCPGSGSFSISVPAGRGYFSIRAGVSDGLGLFNSGGTLRYSID